MGIGLRTRRYAVNAVICLNAAISASHALGDELTPAKIRLSDEPVVEEMEVVQNRYFDKLHRPNFGIFGGSLLKEAYTDTTVFGARFTYFAKEWLAVEVQYARTEVRDTEDRKQLSGMEYRAIDSEKRVHPDPEINAIHAIADLNATFAPFYGKMNLLDILILYTDLYVTTGAARMSTDQGEIPAFTAGLGQRFYFEKNFSFRLDFRSRTYKEQRRGEDYRKQTLSFDAGLDYFFL